MAESAEDAGEDDEESEDESEEESDPTSPEIVGVTATPAAFGSDDGLGGGGGPSLHDAYAGQGEGPGGAPNFAAPPMFASGYVAPDLAAESGASLLA